MENPSFRDRNGAIILTNRNPRGDKFSQWQIEKVDGNFALKSDSSGFYLDESKSYRKPSLADCSSSQRR